MYVYFTSICDGDAPLIWKVDERGNSATCLSLKYQSNKPVKCVLSEELIASLSAIDGITEQDQLLKITDYKAFCAKNELKHLNDLMVLGAIRLHRVGTRSFSAVLSGLSPRSRAAQNPPDLARANSSPESTVPDQAADSISVQPSPQRGSDDSSTSDSAPSSQSYLDRLVKDSGHKGRFTVYEGDLQEQILSPLTSAGNKVLLGSSRPVSILSTLKIHSEAPLRKQQVQLLRNLYDGIFAKIHDEFSPEDRKILDLYLRDSLLCATSFEAWASIPSHTETLIKKKPDLTRSGFIAQPNAAVDLNALQTRKIYEERLLDVKTTHRLLRYLSDPEIEIETLEISNEAHRRVLAEFKSGLAPKQAEMKPLLQRLLKLSAYLLLLEYYSNKITVETLAEKGGVRLDLGLEQFAELQAKNKPLDFAFNQLDPQDKMVQNYDEIRLNAYQSLKRVLQSLLARSSASPQTVSRKRIFEDSQEACLQSVLKGLREHLIKKTTPDHYEGQAVLEKEKPSVIPVSDYYILPELAARLQALEVPNGRPNTEKYDAALLAGVIRIVDLCVSENTNPDRIHPSMP